MAIESQNIYKNARKSAGFTQEKASQLLNVSVDSLRDYEQSQRPVPSDVASAMCDVYQAPYLAVQHLRLTSDLGKRVVPEIQLKDLPEAVLGVLAAKSPQMARSLRASKPNGTKSCVWPMT